MDTVDLAALNRRFGLPGSLNFREGPAGMAVADIRTAQAAAAIALYGAQLLGWTPKGHAPVVWLSPQAQFIEGKPIRGGSPICWPWVGPHPTQPDYPGHGFVRTLHWEVCETAQLQDGSVVLALRPMSGESLNPFWPYATPLEMRFTVGKTLLMELLTRNNEAISVTIGQALHTYFSVADIGRSRILGLDGCPYIDKADGLMRKLQEDGVYFSGEVDRIYLQASGDCLLDDPGFKRRIRIAKRGSSSTIVWNPWADKAGRMSDLGEAHYAGMVCVESANAADDVVSIAPGGEHRLQVKYSVEDW